MNIIKTAIYVFIIIAGVTECFAGLGVTRKVPSVCGFVISSAAGVYIGTTSRSNVFGILTVLLLGTVLTVAAYVFPRFGIIMHSAFVPSAAVYAVCGKPTAALAAAVLSAVMTVFLFRPAVIAVTSFSGSAAALISVFGITGHTFGEKPVLFLALWIAISAAGVIRQSVVSHRHPSESPFSRMHTAQYPIPEPSPSVSEIKYPGMQRAYRNFCIKCGCEMHDAAQSGICPRCGFSFDDDMPYLRHTS